MYFEHIYFYLTFYLSKKKLNIYTSWILKFIYLNVESLWNGKNFLQDKIIKNCIVSFEEFSEKKKKTSSKISLIRYNETRNISRDLSSSTILRVKISRLVVMQIQSKRGLSTFTLLLEYLRNRFYIKSTLCTINNRSRLQFESNNNSFTLAVWQLWKKGVVVNRNRAFGADLRIRGISPDSSKRAKTGTTLNVFKSKLENSEAASPRSV